MRRMWLDDWSTLNRWTGGAPIQWNVWHFHNTLMAPLSPQLILLSSLPTPTYCHLNFILINTDTDWSTDNEQSEAASLLHLHLGHICFSVQTDLTFTEKCDIHCHLWVQVFPGKQTTSGQYWNIIGNYMFENTINFKQNDTEQVVEGEMHGIIYFTYWFETKYNSIS